MKSNNHLAREAQAIIKDLRLLKSAGSIGKAELVGSVALGLIVKRDIDIHVFIGRKKLMPAVYKLSTMLLDHPKINEVRLSDCRNKNSIKIGIDEVGSTSGNWTIDLWVTTDESTLVFKETKEMLKKLTPANRKTILTIKRYYYKQGLLRHGMSSRIYDAVLNEGVTSVQGFKKLK